MNFYGDEDFWQEPDFLLTDLISMLVNSGYVNLGITVMVKGMVLSGTLVSERSYLAAMSETLAEQARQSLVMPSKEDLELIREVFNLNGLAEDKSPSVDDVDEGDKAAPVNGASKSTNASNGFTPDDELDDDFDDDEFDPEEDFEPGDVPPIIRYMHLKDVYILLPVPHDGFTQSFVPIWRIKLTSIDGWLLGQAVPNVPPGSSPTKTDD